MLQIGARNMQNYRCSRPSASRGKPVLLKRGMSATIDEFLLAAEYILDRGNPNVMLCERGIRTFEDHTRFTLPLATVPYLHADEPPAGRGRPVHGTGKAQLVAPMAKAAVAAGADGLIVEVHHDPEHALSDGPDAHPRRLQDDEGVPADRRGRRPHTLESLDRHLRSSTPYPRSRYHVVTDTAALAPVSLQAEDDLS